MTEAQKLQRILDTELSKPLPDSDVLYALRQRLPYANTIDTEKTKRGNLKLSRIMLTPKRYRDTLGVSRHKRSEGRFAMLWPQNISNGA